MLNVRNWVLWKIPRVRQQVRTAFFAAVAGLTMRSIVVRRIVLTLVLITAAILSASAWCSSRSQLAAHLTFPVSVSIADFEFRIADFWGELTLREVDLKLMAYLNL
jgi:hypothetical protein